VPRQAYDIVIVGGATAAIAVEHYLSSNFPAEE
jgi:hypothetical protein